MSYLAIGNDELGDDLTDFIQCPHCNQEHQLQHSKDDPRNAGTKINLSFYKCGEKTYLAGINNRSIPTPAVKSTPSTESLFPSQRPLHEVIIDAWWHRDHNTRTDVDHAANVIDALYRWLSTYGELNHLEDQISPVLAVLDREEAAARKTY